MKTRLLRWHLRLGEILTTLTVSAVQTAVTTYITSNSKTKSNFQVALALPLHSSPVCSASALALGDPFHCRYSTGTVLDLLLVSWRCFEMILVNNQANIISNISMHNISQFLFINYELGPEAVINITFSFTSFRP